MSYENKGSMPTTVMVSIHPDRSGNFVCDGTADDVQILLADAYLAVLGGGTLHIKTLPMGVTYYDITQTLAFTSDNITVEGEGWNTVLRLANDVDNHLMFFDGLTYIVVREMELDGNSPNNPCDDPGFSDVLRFKDCYDVWVDRVYVLNAGEYGINIGTSTGTVGQRAIFSNNYVNGAGGNGIYAAYIADMEVIISRNFVTNCCDVGICVAHINGSAAIIANNFVWDNNSVIDPCWPANPFQGILVEGDAVDIMYEVVISGNMVLDHDDEGIAVDANGTGKVTIVGNFLDGNRVGIRPAGNHVTVVGNISLNHSGDGANAVYCGSSTYLTISGNIFDDRIQIDNADYISISDNVLYGSAQVGILAQDMAYFSITGNIIVNSTSHGINLHDSGSPYTTRGVISSNSIYNAGGIGILLGSDNSYIRITSNMIDGSGDHGIEVLGGAELDIEGNTVSNSTNHAIEVTNVGCKIDGNYVYETTAATQYGIHATNCDHSHITGNYVEETSNVGIYCTDSTGLSVVGNHVFDIGLTAIYISGTSTIDYVLVSGNICETLGGGTGIYLNKQQYAMVTANVCTGCPNRGIWFQETTYSIISNNISSNNTGSGIHLTYLSNYNFIYGNSLISNSTYGIDIAVANCTNNRVGSNYMTGNTTGYINDTGTATELLTHELQFVDGTLFLAADGAPWGWEIDLNTEYAIAIGHLPLYVQEVVRWKIWAISLVDEADAMRLEIVGRAAASNEPYTTESIDIANKASTTTNFVTNDVIYWILTSADDADLDDIVGGDALIVKVKHEAAGNGDCATDAVFLSLEIEYV